MQRCTVKAPSRRNLDLRLNIWGRFVWVSSVWRTANFRVRFSKCSLYSNPSSVLTLNKNWTKKITNPFVPLRTTHVTQHSLASNAQFESQRYLIPKENWHKQLDNLELAQYVYFFHNEVSNEISTTIEWSNMNGFRLLFITKVTEPLQSISEFANVYSINVDTWKFVATQQGSDKEIFNTQTTV